MLKTHSWSNLLILNPIDTEEGVKNINTIQIQIEHEHMSDIYFVH